MPPVRKPPELRDEPIIGRGIFYPAARSAWVREEFHDLCARLAPGNMREPRAVRGNHGFGPPEKRDLSLNRQASEHNPAKTARFKHGDEIIFVQHPPQSCIAAADVDAVCPAVMRSAPIKKAREVVQDREPK